jgi:hypothetical protein
VRECVIQRVKNNKKDSIALAKHAREVTANLFDALKMRNDLGSLKPAIEHFVEFVTRNLSRLISHIYRRTLGSIAAFAQKCAGRSIFKRMLRKQRDANNLKKWEKQLTRAFERFEVRRFLNSIC